MKTNWIIKKENTKLRDKLSKSLNISPITAQILLNRGIENETEANIFLNCTLFDLPSPYLMKGMDVAIERIKKEPFFLITDPIIGNEDGSGTGIIEIGGNP